MNTVLDIKVKTLVRGKSSQRREGPNTRLKTALGELQELQSIKLVVNGPLGGTLQNPIVPIGISTRLRLRDQLVINGVPKGATS